MNTKTGPFFENKVRTAAGPIASPKRRQPLDNMVFSPVATLPGAVQAHRVLLIARKWGLGVAMNSCGGVMTPVLFSRKPLSSRIGFQALALALLVCSNNSFLAPSRLFGCYRARGGRCFSRLFSWLCLLNNTYHDMCGNSIPYINEGVTWGKVSCLMRFSILQLKDNSRLYLS